MIPQRNISLLSNRLAREGGRRTPEAVLERDYCLAWFLVGLSSSPVRWQIFLPLTKFIVPYDVHYAWLV